MNSLLHHDNIEELATIVFEKVDRAHEDGKKVNVHTLTCEIFGFVKGVTKNLSTTDEFFAVCSAIDFLIEEDSIWFDTRDGAVQLT